MSQLLEKIAKETENIKKQQDENLENYAKKTDKLRSEIRSLEGKKKNISDFLDNSLSEKLAELEVKIEEAKQEQLNFKAKQSVLKKQLSYHNKDVTAFKSQKVKDE